MLILLIRIHPLKIQCKYLLKYIFGSLTLVILECIAKN